MNASTVTKTNRAYGLVRRSKPYYHTTGGGGKEEQQQEQEQEQEEGRRRNGPAELRLSKRGQSRQAKCSCRGARPGCRGNTGGGRGREGSAVRCANPRGLHRQVRSRIWESMRVRRCTTGTRRTPQFSTKVEIHGFADVTPNGLYVRHHLPQYFLNGMGHPQKSHKTDKRPTPHVPGDPGDNGRRTNGSRVAPSFPPSARRGDSHLGSSVRVACEGRLLTNDVRGYTNRNVD